MEVGLNKRAKVLRYYEVECYQICYYLLQQEAGALEAASKAIYDLFLDERFFKLNKDNQKKLMRHAAISSALKLYKNGFFKQKHPSS